MLALHNQSCPRSGFSAQKLSLLLFLLLLGFCIWNVSFKKYQASPATPERADQHDLLADFDSPNPTRYPSISRRRERALLHKYMQTSKIYLEFGSGGSTFDALKIMNASNQVVYSVEGNQEWYDYLKQWKFIRDKIAQKKLNFILAYIGPTTRLSYPKKEMSALFPNYYNILHTPVASTVDTVFIDGRFRVMCTLQVVKHCPSTVRILIHDWSIRPQYHILLNYLEIVDYADSLYVFSVKRDMNDTALSADMEKYRNVML